MAKNQSSKKAKIKKPDKGVVYLIIDNIYGRNGIDIREDYGGAMGAAARSRASQWLHRMAGDSITLTDLQFKLSAKEVIVPVSVPSEDDKALEYAKVQHMLGHHSWSSFVNFSKVKNIDPNGVTSVYICSLDRLDDIITRGLYIVQTAREMSNSVSPFLFHRVQRQCHFGPQSSTLP